MSTAKPNNGNFFIPPGYDQNKKIPFAIFLKRLYDIVIAVSNNQNNEEQGIDLQAIKKAFQPGGNAQDVFNNTCGQVEGFYPQWKQDVLHFMGGDKNKANSTTTCVLKEKKDLQIDLHTDKTLFKLVSGSLYIRLKSYVKDDKDVQPCKPSEPNDIPASLIRASTASLSAQPSTASLSAQPSTTSLSAQPSTTSLSAQPSKASLSAQTSTASLSAQPSTASLSAQPSKAPLSAQTSKASLSAQPSKASLSAQPSKASLSAQPSKASLSVQPSKASLSVLNPTKSFQVPYSNPKIIAYKFEDFTMNETIAFTKQFENNALLIGPRYIKTVVGDTKKVYECTIKVLYTEVQGISPDVYINTDTLFKTSNTGTPSIRVTIPMKYIVLSISITPQESNTIGNPNVTLSIPEQLKEWEVKYFVRAWMVSQLVTDNTFAVIDIDSKEVFCESLVNDSLVNGTSKQMCEDLTPMQPKQAIQNILKGLRKHEQAVSSNQGLCASITLDDMKREMAFHMDSRKTYDMDTHLAEDITHVTINTVDIFNQIDDLTKSSDVTITYPSPKGGNNTKKIVHVLGKDRVARKKGRAWLIRYQNEFISITEARELEKAQVAKVGAKPRSKSVKAKPTIAKPSTQPAKSSKTSKTKVKPTIKPSKRPSAKPSKKPAARK